MEEREERKDAEKRGERKGAEKRGEIPERSSSLS